ncbi:hypothetical protein GLE_4551 [Lysobacter enzymogenes]|uniref:Uncharacterized protein n=1 Tax=Lysobacter enzymogenes TaxID=69 RepID=A0A0S2DMY6_LYSEN|nr:hypothetical protein GLE_4551 [Lysobacter enzymogenes]
MSAAAWRPERRASGLKALPQQPRKPWGLLWEGLQPRRFCVRCRAAT